MTIGVNTAANRDIPVYTHTTPSISKNGSTIESLAGGAEKHQAIRAALLGRWINGLETDEESALALLAD